MDKISVIVPCYNMEKFVKRVISSLKKQTYKDIEVILVDDGSRDKTKNIIKKEIKNDKRFFYFYKKNGGLSSARNYGLEKAKGKYICFVDSDDYVEKDYVEKLYDSIIKNKSDLAICSFNRIYGDYTKVNSYKKSFSSFIKHPAAWNKMYHIDLFKKYNIKYLEGKWYEDLGVTSKILMISNKISIIEKPLYNYIFAANPNSIMHTYDDRIYQIYDIVEDIEDFAKKNKIYTEQYLNIEFIHIYHILIGTIYRSSFVKGFNLKTIENIINYVYTKYPKWYKNNNIKDLSFVFKSYLFLVKIKGCFILFILLKLFNNKIKI